MKNLMLNQLAPILNSEKEKIVCHFLIAFSFLRYFLLFFGKPGTAGSQLEVFPSQLEAEKMSRFRQKNFLNYLPKKNVYSKKKKNAISLCTEDKINKFLCTRVQR